MPSKSHAFSCQICLRTDNHVAKTIFGRLSTLQALLGLFCVVYHGSCKESAGSGGRTPLIAWVSVRYPLQSPYSHGQPCTIHSGTCIEKELSVHHLFVLPRSIKSLDGAFSLAGYMGSLLLSLMLHPGNFLGYGLKRN